MSRVGEALKRKIGPLPAWAWTLIAGVGIYLYRRSHASVTGTGTGSVAPTPVTPQDSTTLDPGQSLYDPNSGALVTAPGGDSGGSDTSNTDLADAIAALTTALAQQPTSDGSTPSDPGSGTTSTTPAAARMSKLTKAQTKSGAIALPFGGKKPRTNIPKGYQEVGTGKGNWILRPIKTARNAVKNKPGSSRSKKPKTDTSTKPGSKGRSRSGATIKRNNGGRTVGAKLTFPKAKINRSRSITPNTSVDSGYSRVRSRNTHPAVGKPKPAQHPVATHPAAKPKVAPPPPPRPSAPHTSPPRAKVKPAPKPTPKKRK